MPSTGFLRNLSIKKKLVLIIMLVSSVGLLLAGGSFITYEWFSLRKHMINDLNTHSEMIADNCTGSLSFDDPQDAEEVLGSLKHNHPIEYACVYRSDGALFTSYKREDVNTILSSEPQQDGCRFEDGRLVLFKQITLNNRPIGTLYLQSDLSLISRFLKESIIALAIVILLSSIIAYLLASRLQKVVSTPIFYLAKIASIITQKGDYSVRAIKHSKDELGVLTDAFNNMLVQVEKREISLKESEERFRAIFEQAAVGVAQIVSKTGQFLRINQRYCDIVGYTQEEMTSTTFMAITHPDDLQIDLDNMQKLIKGEIHKFSMEKRYYHKDGSVVWVNLTVSSMLNVGEEPDYHIAVVEDITERKKAEEALHESEEKYRSLFDAAGDAIFIAKATEEGKTLIVDCNEHTLDIFGCSLDDIIGKSVEDLSPSVQPDGRLSKEVISEKVKDVLVGNPQFVEFTHCKLDGTLFETEVTVNRLVVEKETYLQAIIRDVTERKRTESELENYRKHLEVLVKDRTSELEEVHDELVRKERLAALGELIATVSHEIRNPLGTVRNAVYSIGEALDKNKMDLVNRSLELAENNITRCNRIINELLDYSRKREIKLERTEIDSWLNGVLDEQEFPEEIECVRKLHSGIELQIDREYIRRVVYNVITNAIQALQEEDSKGNRITVESVESGEQLELRFIDTGPGIPDDIREKIFEPLFSTKSFGVGLGVPIIKNIMEEHQGEVKFQSEVDKGTVVTLSLPIHKVEKKK